MCEVIFTSGKRVVLRPVMEKDLPLFVKWINDPEVSQFLSVYFPMMEADEKSWLENLPKRKPGNIVFTIVVDGKAIGNIGLHGIEMKDRTATTGTFIGEKEYWGKGYGTEAKMLLLNYAFNTLNLRKICSAAIAFNTRSINYSLKCGYEIEGKLRDHTYRHGKYWDHILFAVFREKWEPLWAEFKKAHDITTL